ncbi:hypothetical protein PT974_10146 [Cladobotryum mycophilum]|uniref:Uncharacterized protein n=1 Tax=Cladobotryum mycophilum TaxID=491253 RepID=A0ABR0S919_9HYPO
MCRMVIFSGTCTRCGDAQTWDELSQELSCLEAKNNGFFGECSNGVFAEHHAFDQECDRCSEEDEGIGDLEDQLVEDLFTQGKRLAEEESTRNDRKRIKT